MKKRRGRKRSRRWFARSISVSRDGIRATASSRKGLYVLEVPWSRIKHFVVKYGKLKYPTRKITKKERERIVESRRRHIDKWKRFRRWEKAQKKR